jgi:hypothetical protein
MLAVDILVAYHGSRAVRMYLDEVDSIDGKETQAGNIVEYTCERLNLPAL